MSDSENSDEVNSEEEDDDYVPSGEEEEVLEEQNSGDDDSEDDDSDEKKHRKGERQSARLQVPVPKRGKKSSLKRGRTTRRVKYEDEESNDSEAEDNDNGSCETPTKKAKPEDEVVEKKRVDDLWSSFLSDVTPKKPTTNQKVLVQKGTNVEVQGGDSSSSEFHAPPLKTATDAATDAAKPPRGPPSDKMTITKVFDFAGEEIKVTKEVSLDSEEARQELAKQEAAKCSTKDVDSPTTTTTQSSNSSESKSSQECDKGKALARAGAKVGASGASPSSGATPSGAATPSSGAVQRILALGKPVPSSAASPKKGGLSNIMDKIGAGGKNKKMTVLDKTSLDWKNFKDKEGIAEELSTFNKGKGGFLERQKFLERTDYKQFEMERNFRLGKR